MLSEAQWMYETDKKIQGVVLQNYLMTKICLNYCLPVQKFDIEKNLSDDKIFDLFHSIL